MAFSYTQITNSGHISTHAIILRHIINVTDIETLNAVI